MYTQLEGVQQTDEVKFQNILHSFTAQLKGTQGQDKAFLTFCITGF